MRLWIYMAAVIIGFLSVDLLPSFTPSVHRHMGLLHRSYPPIPAPSPVSCPLKLESLQKN
jgi:hypothetical protein